MSLNITNYLQLAQTDLLNVQIITYFFSKCTEVKMLVQ